MYNENKYTEIYIKIRSKFEKKSIESILNCGLSLNLEYYLRMDSLDKSLIIQHLLDLSNDNAYQFRILYKESGFDLRFFRSSEGWFSIRCYYFADFLTTKADYEECDEQVFDTIKYLEIVVFLCKYLVIERIRVVDDEESEAIQLTDPVQNTVSVRTGSTYYLRSPYQYLIMVLNNIIDSGGRVASESEDINEAARNLAGYLTEQPETGVSLIFALQDQNFELRIYRENLVLKSLDSLKIKTDNDIEFVDVAYYTEIMMKLCKDLGIRDLQTYFEQILVYRELLELKIVQIDWISREALEAEVTLTDGSFDVVCFAHPFIGKVGEIINQEISTLNSDQIYRMQDTEYLVEKLADPFAYRLSGKVLNKKMPLVQIGDFKIILDNNLPGDLEEGQYVSFICDRLDID